MISGRLAQAVTRALHERWPDVRFSSTSAGTDRVSVVMPPAQAQALALAGPGQSLERAGAELSALMAQPVRVVSVTRRDRPARYTAVIEIGA